MKSASPTPTAIRRTVSYNIDTPAKGVCWTEGSSNSNIATTWPNNATKNRREGKNMKIASIISGSAALLGCALSLNAGAHALWLESGTPGSKLYFGEYAENLREISPGRLDSIV